MKSSRTTVFLAVGCCLLGGLAQAAAGYTLTVNSGTGDGDYPAGTPVGITADPAPSGQAFNMWVGDPDGFADWDACKASSSTYTMPDRNMTLTATYRPTSSPTDWWPYFDIFCKETFGAEKEPLAYEIFGNDLAFMSEPGSEWRHVSETSACITFETNLPAKTYVEYGQSTSYGSQTPVSDRYHYLHIYHLRDLLPDRLYHYRFVAEDERANVIYSSDKTFTTATPPSVVYVPAGVSGPPYNLSVAGNTYLVTEDLICNRTAFNVNNNNITLDLGGHTVTYNQEDYQVVTDYRDTSSIGVRAVSRSNVKVVNGVIKQGLGYNTADNSSIGYSPAHLHGCSGELAGILIDYAGPQVSGFRLDYSSSLVAHHNVILDRGGDVDDRHTSPKAIRAAGDCHHNLIKRHRQIAFSAGDNSDYYNNEFYVDSCATNGAGIMFYKSTNSSAYGNRIFGTGYLVIGISTVSSGIADVMVHDNFIHLQATRPDDRWPEYGPQSGAYCCRITWGGDNIQYYDNVMATYARDGGMVRGTWFCATPTIVDCVYRDNTLQAVLENLASDIQGCIVHDGEDNPNDAPIVYEGNRLISNFCNVRFGEVAWDDTGCNARFYDNTIVKVGPDRPDYRTIDVGWGTSVSTGNEFYDSVFEGGASYDQVVWGGSGPRDFSVGWTLTVQTEPAADVTIRDIFNSLVYSDQADGSGFADAMLYQYLAEPAGRTYHTPHSVTVEKDGNDNTVSVTVDATKTVQIWLLGIPYTLTVNSGSGDGDYPESQVVEIDADPAPSGEEFGAWTGEVGTVADVHDPSTTITMPASDTEVTASYTDYHHTLTVVHGTGDGSYMEGEVAPISADPPSSGKAFALWIGDTAYVADRFEADTTVTMPYGPVTVTASYAWAYTLTVNSGTGDGQYFPGTVVDIEADPAPSGMDFDQWTGDTSPIADVEAPITTITMSSTDAEITATYTGPSYWPGDVNHDFFVGGTDLDYILGDWGHSGTEIINPIADINNDGFVGGTDLDYVLGDWGKTGSPP